MKSWGLFYTLDLRTERELKENMTFFEAGAAHSVLCRTYDRTGAWAACTTA